MSEPPGESTLNLGSAAQPGESPVAPVLRFTAGTQAGRTVRLENGTLTLGRGSENDLVVEDRGVSRIHCKLLTQGHKVHLFDLGSTNGTYLSGRRVAQATLEDGDQIQIGTNVKLRFLLLAPEEKELEQKLYESATSDPLTGVANRRSWLELAGTMMADSLVKGKAVSLALVDLDHFRKLNDTYGPAAGDAVLVEFCRRTRGLGKEVLIGRYGGEEFALLLPGMPSDRATARLERLRGDIEATPFSLTPDQSVRVTVSVGVVTALSPGQGRLDEMLRRADQALYKAKESGRNRVLAAAAAPSQSSSQPTASLFWEQKRRNSRMRCQGDIFIRARNHDFSARLIDISVGGLHMQVIQNVNIPLDEPLELRLRQDPENAIAAVVKWTKGKQVGVRFTAPPDQLRTSWVSALLKQLGVNAETARERRAHARVAVECPVTLSAPPVGTYSATARNLGLGGLGAEAALVPPVGTAGTVDVGGLKLPVRVLWVRAPYFGLRFAPLSKSQAGSLQALCITLTKRSPT